MSGSLFAGLFAITLCLAAPTDRGFTAADAFAAIEAGHPLVVAADEGVEEARATAVATGLWKNPQAQLQWDRSVGYTTYHPRIGYPQFGVTQWIEVGAPRARRRAATLEHDARVQDRSALIFELQSHAYEAMVELARAQEAVDVLHDELRRLREAQRIVERRVTSGAAPRYHTTRLNIVQAGLRAAIAEGRAASAAARRDFDVAVGPTSRRLRGRALLDLEKTRPLPSLEDLTATMNERRADLAAVRTREQGANAEVTAARRSVWSGFGVSLGAAFGGGYDPTRDRTQIDVVASVAIPLPIVDRGQGTVQAARARAAVARELVVASTHTAHASLERAREEVVARREAFATFDSASTELRDAFESEILAGYADGRLSILDVVDALEVLREVRLRRLELAAATRRAEARLWREAGALPNEK